MKTQLQTVAFKSPANRVNLFLPNDFQVTFQDPNNLVKHRSIPYEVMCTVKKVQENSLEVEIVSARLYSS